MNSILCLCDLTGAMAKPWVDAGYQAILVDPQHAPGINVHGPVTKIGQIIDHPTVWEYLRKIRNIDFVAAFPPCTDLAVSGARWFDEKRRANPAVQFKAMQVVWQCHVIAEMIGAPWFIENPVSQISTYWRKPDYHFNPSDFTGYCRDDNYTKKTCLWAGGGFVMPLPHRDATLPSPDDRIHKMAPGVDRANKRSATPTGFALAIFHSNSANKQMVAA